MTHEDLVYRRWYYEQLADANISPDDIPGDCEDSDDYDPELYRYND